MILIKRFLCGACLFPILFIKKQICTDYSIYPVLLTTPCPGSNQGFLALLGQCWTSELHPQLSRLLRDSFNVVSSLLNLFCCFSSTQSFSLAAPLPVKLPFQASSSQTLPLICMCLYSSMLLTSPKSPTCLPWELTASTFGEHLIPLFAEHISTRPGLHHHLSSLLALSVFSISSPPPKL